MLVGGILLGTLNLLTLVLFCLRPSIRGLFSSDGLCALDSGMTYVCCTLVLVRSDSSNTHGHTWISGVGISFSVVGVLRFSIAVVHSWLLARSSHNNSTATTPVQPGEEEKDTRIPYSCIKPMGRCYLLPGYHQVSHACETCYSTMVMIAPLPHHRHYHMPSCTTRTLFNWTTMTVLRNQTDWQISLIDQDLERSRDDTLGRMPLNLTIHAWYAGLDR